MDQHSWPDKLIYKLFYFFPCIDINECEGPEADNLCMYGTCVNSAGSYTCECTPPLILDSTGRRCIREYFTIHI